MKQKHYRFEPIINKEFELYLHHSKELAEQAKKSSESVSSTSVSEEKTNKTK